MDKPEFVSYMPLYLQLKDIILGKIVNEEYDRDQALPSESMLAKSFGTSISTVRQALSILVAEGVLVKKQGKGTFLSSKKRNLTFFSWLPESPRGQQILEKLIEKYEEREPNIKINVIPTTYPDARKDLMTLITNGEAPDVAQIVSHWTSFFAAHGGLENLDKLMPKSHLSERFREKDLDGGIYQGDLYSVAWGLTPISLIANKSIVNEHGGRELSDILTLDEFKACCTDIRRSGDKKGISPFGMCISGEDTDLLRLYPFFQAFGGLLKGDENRLDFNTDEFQKAFHWLKDFTDQTVPSVGDIFSLRKQLAKGRIAFLFDGPWIRFWLEELTGEPFEKNFTVIQNPVRSRADQSKSWNYNHALSICSQSRNKVFAARFIDAISFDPEISGFYYEMSGHLPVHKERTMIRRNSSPFNLVFEKQLDGSSCINAQNALFEKAMDFCIDAVSNILFKGQDIETELAEKQRYLNILLKS